MTFYIDCLCLLPLDFLYLSVGFRSVFRCFRLVKIYRFWEFLDRTERHTNHPNVVRTMALLHYLFSIYHWNACIMHMIIDSVLKSSSMWPASPSNQGVFAQYLHALYWSTMALTRSVSDPPPVTSAECVFAVVQCVLGILLFAAILGHVANIVASVSAARKDFQGECCAIFIGCCSYVILPIQRLFKLYCMFYAPGHCYYCTSKSTPITINFVFVRTNHVNFKT